MSETTVTGAAFEALPMEAAILDADGRVLRTNTAWNTFGEENDARKTDWTGDDYLGICDASDDALADTAADGLREVIAGERDRFELEYPCHSPTEDRWFILVATRFEHDGDPHLLVTHLNITERKLAEQAVEATNDQLETVTQVLSHDLRNPLGVAQGYVELLAEDLDRDELATVRNALDRIEAIIEDAVVIGRGELGSDPTPVDLTTTARDAWDNVVTESAELRVETELTINADPSLLGNLLENLFRNAVEHAGDSVTVTVRPVEDGFAVGDDGPGIPTDRRDAVLEAGESGGGGTGLGLAIVERVAEAHGWTVEVGESPAGGAEFTFRGVSLDG